MFDTTRRVFLGAVAALTTTGATDAPTTARSDDVDESDETRQVRDMHQEPDLGVESLSVSEEETLLDLHTESENLTVEIDANEWYYGDDPGALVNLNLHTQAAYLGTSFTPEEARQLAETLSRKADAADEWVVQETERIQESE